MKKSPLREVKDRFEDKESLVAAVRELAGEELFLDRLNEDKGLENVSNKKLLHLHALLLAVKSECGSRDGLVDGILRLEDRGKDADYKKHFAGWSTPRLWDHYRALQKKS